MGRRLQEKGIMSYGWPCGESISVFFVTNALFGVPEDFKFPIKSRRCGLGRVGCSFVSKWQMVDERHLIMKKRDSFHCY